MSKEEEKNKRKKGNIKKSTIQKLLFELWKCISCIGNDGGPSIRNEIHFRQRETEKDRERQREAMMGVPAYVMRFFFSQRETKRDRKREKERDRKVKR